MKTLFNLVGALLIVGFALYVGIYLATDLNDHTPSWAGEAAVRRSIALMVYFVVSLIVAVGFLALGAINRLLG